MVKFAFFFMSRCASLIEFNEVGRFIYSFRNSSAMHHEDLQAVLQKYTIISAGND